MPDTKTGRERKGRNKRRQLESHLNRRELDAADEPPELASTAADLEYLTEAEPESLTEAEPEYLTEAEPESRLGADAFGQ